VRGINFFVPVSRVREHLGASQHVFKTGVEKEQERMKAQEVRARAEYMREIGALPPGAACEPGDYNLYYPLSHISRGYSQPNRSTRDPSPYWRQYLSKPITRKSRGRF